MKIELKLELTPGTARRVGIVGATLLVLGTAVAVYANQISFTSGQLLTAADLNNNFNELYARTSAKGANSSMSTNATYCGVTTATYSGGQFGGYSGGKAKCETACTAATAHVCSPEELGRTKQLGASFPTVPIGWIANIVVDFQQTNCNGWTSNDGTLAGSALFTSASTGDNAFITSCDKSIPLVCCN